MIDTVLFYAHHGLTLLWGVVLSAAFCGVRCSKKNMGILALIFAACGVSQLSVLAVLGEQRVWELYPLIVHVLLGVLLYLTFRVRFATILTSICLAYLCCQPSKWFGLLTEAFVTDATVIWLVRIGIALATFLLVIRYCAALVAELLSKESRIVLFFCAVPVVYYLFDYVFGVYTDLWDTYHYLAADFLAFFLCVAFLLFCVVYHKEYERKNQAQRKNQLIEITVQQQAKELEAIRKSALETSLLRHDMRLLLSNLALYIERGDKENANKLISGYVAQVESAALQRFCENDVVNYILTNFQSKCAKAGVAFQVDLKMEALTVDEVMFSSILSNALDNALNAQMELPAEGRQIKLLLKHADGRLLLSVRNPFWGEPPTYVNQLPISKREGHGYGTQSILYLTEKLGGKCRFSVQKNIFILQVIL